MGFIPFGSGAQPNNGGGGAPAGGGKFIPWGGGSSPSPALPSPPATTPPAPKTPVSATPMIGEGNGAADTSTTPVAPNSAMAPSPATKLLPSTAFSGSLGGGYGASNETDPSSGKPLLTYENMEAQSSQLLSDRTAPSFDPTVPQKLDNSILQNGRMPESVSQTIKDAIPGSAFDELDHIMPLELGGSNNKSNLRLEPGQNAGEKYNPGTNPTATDPLENQLKAEVYAGKISLLDAWKQMAAAKDITLPEQGGPIASNADIQPNKQTYGFWGNLWNGIKGAANGFFSAAQQTNEADTNLAEGAAGTVAKAGIDVAEHPQSAVAGAAVGTVQGTANVFMDGLAGGANIVGAKGFSKYVEDNKDAMNQIVAASMPDATAEHANAVGQFVGQQVPYILAGEGLGEVAAGGAKAALLAKGGDLTLSQISTIGKVTKIASNVLGFTAMNQLTMAPGSTGGDRLTQLRNDVLVLGTLEGLSAGIDAYKNAKWTAEAKSFMSDLKTGNMTTDQIAEKAAELTATIKEETGKAPQDLLAETVKGETESNPIGVQKNPNLQGEHAAVQDRFTNEVNTKTDELVKQYKDQYGKVINTDNARELSKDYAPGGPDATDEATKEARGKFAFAVHEPASALTKEIYSRDLEANQGKGNNTVLFTAGISGAGKTTAVRSALADLGDYPIIYDTNMNGFDSSKVKIEQALAKGYNVHVVFVDRDPVEAYKNGVLPRAESNGRTVTPETHLNNGKSYETVPKLHDHYEKDPRVSFQVLDNNNGPGQQTESDIDSIRKKRYNEGEVKQSLNQELQKQYEEGKISQRVYEASKSPEVGPGAEEVSKPGSRGGLEEGNRGATPGSPEGNGASEKIEPNAALKKAVEQTQRVRPGSITLASGFNPGLDKFIETDVKPLAGAVKEAGSEVAAGVNPQGASPAARSAADLIRNAKANIANLADVEAYDNKQYMDFFKKQSTEEGVANISEYERTGTFKNAPEGYSEFYAKSIDNSREIMKQAYGDDRVGYIENYVRRMYKFGSKADEDKATAYLMNQFTGSLSATKSPLKGRVLDMPLDEALQDMRSRGIKVTPVTANPEELRQWSMANARQALSYRQVWDAAKDQGIVKFIPNGGRVPDGFVRLDDRAAQVFAPAETAQGSTVLVNRGQYYADPNVARVFNNTISKGLGASATFRGIRIMENQLNFLQLGLSGFHLSGTAINASVSDLALGLRQAMNGEVRQGIGSAGRALVPGYSFGRDMIKGNSLIKGLQEGAPEAYDFLKTKLNPAGGRLSLDSRYRGHMADEMLQAFRDGNYVSGLTRVPGAVIETVARPLMNYAIPRVKIGAFMDLAAEAVKNLPEGASEAEVQKALANSWDSIDNRFGQLVYDNLFWNKTAKDIAMTSVRSVGWNLGTVRELGGGLKDLMTKTALGKGITDRTLYTLALPIYVGTLGAVYQYLHTGKGPSELKDYFYPKNGLTTATGDPDRTSLPTYMKDVYAYGSNPFMTVVHKSSPIMDMAYSLATNQDYYGNLISNPADPMAKQWEQKGAYILNNALPFSIQQAQQTAAEGGPENAVENFFGFTKAPSTITQSAAEQELNDLLMQYKGPMAAKTPEQQVTAQLKAAARQAIQKGDYSLAQQLVKDGIITEKGYATFVKDAKKTATQRKLQLLPKNVQDQFNAQYPSSTTP